MHCNDTVRCCGHKTLQSRLDSFFVEFSQQLIVHFNVFAGVDKHGKGLLYRNLIDCFVKTFKYEGMRGLYKGFVANYYRCAPHTILNLTFWDLFKKWKDIYLSDEANMFFE